MDAWLTAAVHRSVVRWPAARRGSAVTRPIRPMRLSSLLAALAVTSTVAGAQVPSFFDWTSFGNVFVGGPDQAAITVQPEDKVRYEDLVRIIDECIGAGLPQVSVSAAAG